MKNLIYNAAFVAFGLALWVWHLPGSTREARENRRIRRRIKELERELGDIDKVYERIKAENP